MAGSFLPFVPQVRFTPQLVLVEPLPPVMRTFEPGEACRWCYVDDLLG